MIFALTPFDKRQIPLQKTQSSRNGIAGPKQFCSVAIGLLGHTNHSGNANQYALMIEKIGAAIALRPGTRSPFVRRRTFWLRSLPAELLAAGSGRGEALLGPLRDECALLLRQRGEQVQQERINVAAQLGRDKRHLVNREAGNEMHVPGQPIEFGNDHRRS